MATISYKLYLVDQTTKETKLIEEISNEEFFLGEFDVLPAIDLSVQLMDRGEQATIDSDIRHCYGEKGLPEKNIPPVIDENPSYRMKIDIELIDWKPAEDMMNLSTDQRILWADRKREKGNFALRRQDYPTAIQCYRHAVRFVDADENLVDRYVQIENNLAQVYLLTTQYDQCLETIDNVLKHDEKNVKGLFRRARALFQLGKYDEAIEPLKILLEIDDQDVEKSRIAEMLKICQKKLEKYRQNEKEIYQRMFKSKSTPNFERKEKPGKVEHSRRNLYLLSSFFVLLIGILLTWKLS